MESNRPSVVEPMVERQSDTFMVASLDKIVEYGHLPLDTELLATARKD